MAEEQKQQGARTFDQKSPYHSPWSVRQRMAMLVWEYCWVICCRWTPKPCNRWRLFWLRIFGARIHGMPFVHQRARIQIPWNVTLHDRATLGDRANLYSLGEIEIGARAIVAQEAYLCAGTHDFSVPALPLQVAKITIGEDAFIGARAFILPGVTVGARAVVGACALVTKDVAPSAIVAGNPATQVRMRGAQAP